MSCRVVLCCVVAYCGAETQTRYTLSSRKERIDGREGGREGREGWREGGKEREGGREGGRERKGGREGGREGREGGREERKRGMKTKTNKKTSSPWKTQLVFFGFFDANLT